MSEQPQPDRPRETSEPVRQMVATASDEQLDAIVGSDSHFYSEEAIEAAAHELEERRGREVAVRPTPRFDAAAFALGPIWYFYHGMIGRGVLIAAVLLGALLGLDPVADALGIPPLLWALVVVVSIGGYCSRYAARDLEESRLQARLTARRPVARRRND